MMWNRDVDRNRDVLRRGVDRSKWDRRGVGRSSRDVERRGVDRKRGGVDRSKLDRRSEGRSSRDVERRGVGRRREKRGVGRSGGERRGVGRSRGEKRGVGRSRGERSVGRSRGERRGLGRSTGERRGVARSRGERRDGDRNRVEMVCRRDCDGSVRTSSDSGWGKSNKHLTGWLRETEKSNARRLDIIHHTNLLPHLLQWELENCSAVVALLYQMQPQSWLDRPNSFMAGLSLPNPQSQFSH